MAKSIRLGAAPVAPPASPSAQTTEAAKETLDATATGQRNGPPLVAGDFYRGPDMNHLSAVPAFAAVQAKAISAQARADVVAGADVLPVDPNTKPVTLQPVDINRLSPSDQEKYRQFLAA